MKIIKYIKLFLLISFIIFFEFTYSNLFSSNSYYYFSLAEIAINNGDFTKADSLLQKAQKLDPNSLEIINERLTVLYYLGKNKEIIKLCKKTIKKYPSNPNFYLMLADSYQKLDNIKKAKKYLNIAEENAGTDVEFLFKIAVQYTKLDEKEKYISLLKKVLTIQPNFINANAWLGDYYFNQNNYTKSIEYLEYLLDYKEAILTSHPSFIRQLILSYYYTQNYDKIIELSKSLPLENLGSTIIRILFISSYKTQNYQMTINYGNKILQKSNRSEKGLIDETNEILAIAEYKLQDFYKSFDHFSKIENKNILLRNLKMIATVSHLINRADLLNNLIVTYSKENNDTLLYTLKVITAYFYAEKDSIQLSNKILDEIDLKKLLTKLEDDYILNLLSFTVMKAKNDVNTVKEILNKRKDKTTPTTLWIGNFYKNEKQYEKAIHCHNEALKEDSTNIAIYFSLAAIYNILKDEENEIVVLENALKYFPENSELLNWLGYSLVDNNIRFDYALSLLEKAISLEPDNVYIWDSLAWAYYKLNNYKKAMEAMKLVIEEDIQDTVIRYHIGNIYWKLGQIESAKENWNFAIKINNNEEAKVKSEEMIRKLTGEHNEVKKEN